MPDATAAELAWSVRLGLALIGYVLGSVPFGLILTRLAGLGDIRAVGSGNIGATNVLRAVGLWPAVFVVIADPLKAMLAILIASALGVSEWGLALAGFATVIGNNFNIFLGLRGGKGVATSIGVGLALVPLATLAAGAVGLFTIALSRYVSLGSMVAMFSAFFFLIMGPFSPPQLFLVVALAVLVIFRHRENIKRLANGTERRLGVKAEGVSETGGGAKEVSGA